MSLYKKPEFAYEEGIKIRTYGNKINKKLNVFYNPAMKLNRDISLLVIKTYFDKKIKFCDPMAASGIRELRFLQTIPEKFEKLIIADISKTAIKNIKKNITHNFLNPINSLLYKTHIQNKINNIKIKYLNQDALNTINSDYFDFIEIDPFGSPVPFLDIACQKIKHNGILSVTATDTAALCGTYPKTTLRRYNIKIIKTLWHEELGLRNLIAYSQIQAAKYKKVLTPIVSYTDNHYFKIFFKVEESRALALETLKNLKYITYDKKTQEVQIQQYENKNSIGKTFTGPLNDKEFLKNLQTNLPIIKERKKTEKLIQNLLEESNIVGYYNPHKFEKEFKFSSQIKFETIIKELKKQGFEVSRSHNNRLGIKTNANPDKFIKIMKENSY